ncbi:DUF3618 domain-containing protein [Streptomyces sp. NPDC054784]
MTREAKADSRADSPQELRAQVEHAREELADTVSELARKADVKATAKEKTARLKARARDGRDGVLKALPTDRLPGSAGRTGTAHADGTTVEGQDDSPRDEGVASTTEQVRPRPAQLAGLAAAVGAAVAAVLLVRKRRAAQVGRRIGPIDTRPVHTAASTARAKAAKARSKAAKTRAKGHSKAAAKQLKAARKQARRVAGRRGPVERTARRVRAVGKR